MFISSPARPRRAFTLVQTVVVLALLLCLAVLIFPIFGRSKEVPSRIVTCRGNLVQISLGMKQYVQDYDGKFPLVEYGVGPATGWADMIQPYLKNAQVFQCPVEPTPGSSQSGDSGYCDYFYNSNLGPRSGGKLAAQVSSFTILVGDGAPFSSTSSSNGGTLIDTGNDGRGKGFALAQGQWAPEVAGSRHKQGANYLFSDGHVKWHTPQRVTRDPVSFNNPTFRLTVKTRPSAVRKPAQWPENWE